MWVNFHIKKKYVYLIRMMNKEGDLTMWWGEYQNQTNDAITTILFIYSISII